MERITDLIVKYRKVEFFFIAYFFMTTISIWTENYFQHLQYPEIISLNSLTLKNLFVSSLNKLLESIFYCILIIISFEVFNLKKYSIVIASLFIILIGIILSKFFGYNLIFDINAYRWYDRIIYIFILSAVTYFFYKKPENIFYTLLAYFFIFILHSTVQYFAIGISTKHFSPYLNMQQVRFFIYSLIFGGIYLLLKKYFRTKLTNR